MRELAGSGLPPILAASFGLMEAAVRGLTNRIKGMSPDALEYIGGEGNRNSTATLVVHLARTDLDYLHCIMGKPVPAELELEFGPDRAEDETLPAVTGKTAAELLEQYGRVLAMTKAYLSGLPDADGLRTVTVPWWPEPASLRYVLWHMAGHSMFHQGQIVRLQQGYKRQQT